MLGNLLRNLLRGRRRPEGPKRLHLGCGTDIRAGWINLDQRRLPGVDVVADLDACARTQLPFAQSSIEEFYASHVLEHLRDPLGLLQELHRIATPGATAVFRVPYGSSDDADEDPTHVRRFFLKSFYYFSQLGYTHADYGYRGDWDTRSVVLEVDEARYANSTFDEMYEAMHSQRNVVVQMIATLTAVKPIRAPGSVKPDPMKIEFRKVVRKPL